MDTEPGYTIPSNSECTLSLHTIVRTAVLMPSDLAGTRALGSPGGLDLRPLLGLWPAALRRRSGPEAFAGARASACCKWSGFQIFGVLR